MRCGKLNIGGAGWLIAILLGAFWLGTAAVPRSAVPADIKQVESKEQFIAGDERSLPILRDIAATVKQIDARLERIEKILPAQRP